MAKSPTYPDKPTILVVDDIPDNLTLMGELLNHLYVVKVANRGERALKIASSANPPDLILLDIMMPEMDGYEVCRQLKADAGTRHIPVIFLTAKNTAEDEELGLEAGAVDYITKPISPPIMLARVKTHLQVKRFQDMLRDQNEFLENEVRKRTQEIEMIQAVTISSLASLAETRDSDTGHHIRRTQHYIKVLAEKLSTHPKFETLLGDRKTIDLLFNSAPLHDIGKVGIPDRILLKPGPLDSEELEFMHSHTTLGRNAIIRAERELGMEIPFLSFAKEIAYSHHEKWDGSGYPQGLAGNNIPISARLMALADVYDALTCRRVYKGAISDDETVNVIVKGRGTHFDPDIVDAFMEIKEQFRKIGATYADNEGERKTGNQAELIP